MTDRERDVLLRLRELEEKYRGTSHGRALTEAVALYTKVYTLRGDFPEEFDCAS